MRRWLLIWALFYRNCKVTVWQMIELKPYLRRSLATSCSLIFFMNKPEQTQETRLRVQASNNFQFSGTSAEWSKMKRSVELLSRETRRIDFKTAFSLAVYVWMIFTATISSSIFCDAQVKILHAGLTETIFRISTNCSCWDLWQIALKIVLEDLFMFNTIYVHWICFQTRGSLFFCSRHQKNAEEALWIQVTRNAF